MQVEGPWVVPALLDFIGFQGFPDFLAPFLLFINYISDNYIMYQALDALLSALLLRFVASGAW